MADQVRESLADLPDEMRKPIELAYFGAQPTDRWRTYCRSQKAPSRAEFEQG